MLVFAIVVDIVLAVATAREGYEYVQRTFETVPVLVTAWILLWLLWQFALILSLRDGTSASRQNT